MYCDKCKKDIDIKKSIRQYTKKGITRRWITCKSCNSQYDIMYIDKEIKDLIKKNEELQMNYESSMKMASNMMAQMKLTREYNLKIASNKRAMSNKQRVLKREYLGK